VVIEWQQANLKLIQENHLQLYKERSSEDSLILDEQIISDDTSPLNEINDNDSLLKREIIALLNLLQEDQKPLCEILEKFLQTDISNKPAHKMSEDTLTYLDQRFSDYHHIETLKHCIKIAKYEQDYYQQYAQLDDQLRLSRGSIWWQGLRNGLVVFGAFNSLLMTVASMNLLFGIGFTPMFFYVSIIAGLTLLFFTTLYTLLSVNSKEDNIADDQDCPQFKTSNIFVGASTMKIIDDKDIQASQNLLISEHSEVFRQLLSGFKKGIKFLQTISVFLLPLGQNDSILTKLCYIATGMVFSLFFALKGLRGLMRVDEEAYKNSFIYKFLAGDASEKETKNQSISNTDTAQSLESPKKLPRVPSIFRTTEELVITSRLSPIPQCL
jgi:uncharacterized membrane protein YuzA (DUF378 family)